MTPKTARGFLMLSLSSDQREQLMLKERSLPEGRSLVPWEISKFFNLQTGAKTDQQMAQMEELERQNDRKLWKQRNIEDLGLKENRDFPTNNYHQEIHAWDDFVIANWNFSQDVKSDSYS